MAKRQLFAPDGMVTVRADITGNDAGTWSPEDVAAGSRDLVILDGAQWDEVTVVPRFDTPHVNDALSIQALLSVPDAAAPGRRWIAVDAVTALAAQASLKGARFRNDGHDVAFRVTGLTIGAGGANEVDLIATGGRRRINES